MLSFGWCEVCDAGDVVPVKLGSCRVVLMCDECGTVWCRPDELATDGFTTRDPTIGPSAGAIWRNPERFVVRR